MKTIKIWNDNPSESQINEICDLLERGGVVIIPTDTLYGICCDALNPKSIERICRLKGINPDKANLSVICSGISMAAEYSRIGNNEFGIIKDNTPGPFTYLLKSSSSLPKVFKGRKVVGIRIPDCNVARQIAERLGHPVMTTSVECDDYDYAVNAELIAEKYESSVDMMVDAGDGDTEPSTIIDLTSGEPTIIREGKGVLN